jgi:hypothetical protein
MSAQEYLMKKLLLSVLAVGAMATGGVASAQDGLGNVLPQILGNVLGNNGLAGVVAQGNYPAGSVYVDQYGRQVQVDRFGNHVVIGQNTNVLGGGPRVVDDPTGNGRQIVLNADGTYIHPVNGWRMYVTPDGRHLPVNTNTVQARRLDDRGRDVLRDRRDRDRDRDRDRIRDNRDRDRDRDNDGVRNRDDRYPDDPRYR